jgi:hypothetical protein
MDFIDRLFGWRTGPDSPPVVVTCNLLPQLAGRPEAHRLVVKCADLVSVGVAQEFKLKRRQIATSIQAPSSVVFTVRPPNIDSGRLSEFTKEYWKEWMTRASRMGIETVLAMRKM